MRCLLIKASSFIYLNKKKNYFYSYNFSGISPFLADTLLILGNYSDKQKTDLIHKHTKEDQKFLHNLNEHEELKMLEANYKQRIADGSEIFWKCSVHLKKKRLHLKILSESTLLIRTGIISADIQQKCNIPVCINDKDLDINFNNNNEVWNNRVAKL